MCKIVLQHVSFRDKEKFAALTVVLLLSSAFIADFKLASSSSETPSVTAVGTFPGQMFGSYFASNGTLFAGDNNYKLYRSDDNGVSFRLVYTFPKQNSPVGDVAGYVWMVFVDSKDNVFVSIPGTNRLYRSTNFGSIFTEVLNTNGSLNQGFYIAMTEDSNGCLYAATYDNSIYPTKPSILKSADNGTSWTKTFEANCVHFHNIKFNPSNGYLYAVTSEWSLGYDNQDCERVFRSKDFGQTWSCVVNRTKIDDGLGDTIYYALLFDGSWVYLGSDQANKINWIDRIFDDGSNGVYVPQRIYTFPSDCSFPVISAVKLNGTLVFSDSPELYNGVSRIVASDDGVNWQIIKSTNTSNLQHHTNMLTANPQSVAFSSDGPGQTFAVGVAPTTPSQTLFRDGFESGSFSAWTGAGGAGNTHSETVETLSPYSGVYAAVFMASAPSECWAYQNIDASNITDLRQFVKFATLPAIGSRIYLGAIQSGSSQNTVDVYVENVNGQYYWGLFTTVNGAVYDGDKQSAPSSLTTGVYYCIETCRDITNGKSYFWVDGVLQISASHPSVGSSNIVYSGITWAESASTIYVDDVEVSRSYIGSVVTSQPSPTPTPTQSPAPTPSPTPDLNGTLYLTLQISMTATVLGSTYNESSITKPIQSNWIATDGTLYASSGDALYKSPDGGVTWQGLTNCPGGFDSVFVDHRDYVFVSPHAVFSDSALGLWRSTDGGQTWNQTLNLPALCSIWGIDEDTHGTLFAGVYTRGDTFGDARIYRSTDAGATWESAYYDPNCRHVHQIKVDKTNNYIYASVGDLYLNWTYCVVRSTDGGDTWQQILSEMPQVIAIETVPGARLFGTDYPIDRNGRIFKTTDDVTFSSVLETYSDSYVYWIRTNPANGRIYASFTSGEYNPDTAWIYTSDDNGSTWALYKSFNVTGPYCGSTCGSNFVHGVMYYSLETNGWQNGVKIYPTNSSSSEGHTASKLLLLPNVFDAENAGAFFGTLTFCLVGVLLGRRRLHGYLFNGSKFNVIKPQVGGE